MLTRAQVPASDLAAGKVHFGQGSRANAVLRLEGTYANAPGALVLHAFEQAYHGIVQVRLEFNCSAQHCAWCWVCVCSGLLAAC